MKKIHPRLHSNKIHTLQEMHSGYLKVWLWGLKDELSLDPLSLSKVLGYP